MRVVKKSQRPRQTTFASISKSFMGYLVGTQKAAHTITNYRSDLTMFESFLKEQSHSDGPISIDKLTQRDFERYAEYLKAKGFKTNTRRRKLLTIRKLFRFLKSRNRVSVDIASRVATPFKLEKLPEFEPYDILLAAIHALPAQNDLDRRNRLLLWVLLETGCLASECGKILTDGLGIVSNGAEARTILQIQGKNAREVHISEPLYRELQCFIKEAHRKPGPIFSGFNKFGSLGGAISSRGVELVVERFARHHRFQAVTPRSIRHSCVVEWMKQGLDSETIQKYLGLRSQYAFRIYNVLRERMSVQ